MEWQTIAEKLHLTNPLPILKSLCAMRYLNTWRDLFSGPQQHGYAPLLGIDCDETAVFSLQLRASFGKIYLAQANFMIIPDGIISEDNILDSVQFVSVLERLAKTMTHPVENVAIALPGSRAVIREVKIGSVLSDQEVQERAWEEAHRAFPELAKNMFLDYAQFVTGGEDDEHYSLMIVIARKEDLEPRIDAFSQAGFTPKVVDVDYYAIGRIYPLISSQLPKEHEKKYIAMLQFDPRHITMIVMHMGESIFTNRQVLNGDALPGLTKRCMEQDDSITLDAISDEEKMQIVMTIRRQLQAFQAEQNEKKLECAALVGRCALIKPLVKFLENELQLSIIVVNPLVDLSPDESNQNAMIIKLGPAFAESCGLALRGL